MTSKVKFHIAAQLVALAAQTLIPSLPLAVTVQAWVHPIIAFLQTALGIVALYVDPPTGGNSSSGSKLPPPSGAAAIVFLTVACGAVSRPFLGVVCGG